MELTFKSILGLCSLVAVLFGLVDVLTNFEENACEMTWMFQLPEFIPISLDTSVHERFPKYQLIVYGEGSYAQRLRNGTLTGMPVLFVPGNAGSHRQVRSIGSVLMRKSDFGRLDHHFDVFSVDFHEELSGLYGEVLRDETAFLHECIKRVLKLYRSNTSMVLLAHSMGGVVAKALFTLPDFDSYSVSFIVTYATPHRSAVALLDWHMAAFYEKLREMWSENLYRVPIVSIGGGDRDFLVRTDLTSLPHSDLSTTTTSVPAVWVSTDHLCIVWCQQLVLATARALFDLVDKKNKVVISDPQKIREVSQFHFLKQPFGKQLSGYLRPQSMEFGSGGEWIEKFEGSWRFTRAKVLSSVSLTVPLYEQDSIVIVASGLENRDWIFGCTATKDIRGRTVCAKGMSLSVEGERIPAKHSDEERRVFHQQSLSLKMRGFKCLLIKIVATGAKKYNMYGEPVGGHRVTIVGERYRKGGRNKRFPSPSALWAFTPSKVLTIPMTEGAVFYNVTLVGFRHVLQTYLYSLETRICRTGTQGEGIVRYIVPWAHEDRFFHIRTAMGALTPMDLKIHNPVPEGVHYSGVRLELYLDPECSYALFAHFSSKHFLGQAVKHYGGMVPAYSTAQLMLALGFQLSSISATGLCPPLLSALSQAKSAFILIVLPTIFQMWTTFNFVLPQPDSIGAGGFENVSLRAGVYIVGIGINVATVFVFAASAIIFGHLWRRLWLNQNEKLAFKKQMDITWSRLIVCLPLFLVGISLTTSAALALWLGFVISCMKLIGRCGYQRALEDRKGRSGITTGWHLHTTLAILWAYSAFLALPSLLVWAHNIPYSFRLPQDPHLSCSLFVLLSMIVLWQGEIPLVHRFYYKITSSFISCLAVLCVLYCPVKLYAIIYFVAAVFGAVAVQQVIGSDITVKQE